MQVDFYNRSNDDLESTRLLDSYEESIKCIDKEVGAVTRFDFELPSNGYCKYGNHRLIIDCELARLKFPITFGSALEIRHPIPANESVVNDPIPDTTNPKRYLDISDVESNVIIWAKGEGEEVYNNEYRKKEIASREHTFKLSRLSYLLELTTTGLMDWRDSFKISAMMILIIFKEYGGGLFIPRRIDDPTNTNSFASLVALNKMKLDFNDSIWSAILPSVKVRIAIMDRIFSEFITHIKSSYAFKSNRYKSPWLFSFMMKQFYNYDYIVRNEDWIIAQISYEMAPNKTDTEYMVGNLRDGVKNTYESFYGPLHPDVFTGRSYINLLNDFEEFARVDKFASLNNLNSVSAQYDKLVKSISAFGQIAMYKMSEDGRTHYLKLYDSALPYINAYGNKLDRPKAVVNMRKNIDVRIMVGGLGDYSLTGKDLNVLFPEPYSWSMSQFIFRDYPKNLKGSFSFMTFAGLPDNFNDEDPSLNVRNISTTKANYGKISMSIFMNMGDIICDGFNIKFVEPTIVRTVYRYDDWGMSNYLLRMPLTFDRSISSLDMHNIDLNLNKYENGYLVKVCLNHESANKEIYRFRQLIFNDEKMLCQDYESSADKHGLRLNTLNVPFSGIPISGGLTIAFENNSNAVITANKFKLRILALVEYLIQPNSDFITISMTRA